MNEKEVSSRNFVFVKERRKGKASAQALDQRELKGKKIGKVEGGKKGGNWR